MSSQPTTAPCSPPRSRRGRSHRRVCRGHEPRARDHDTVREGPRIQFGAPIGKYQGVKHPLAEMLVDVETSRSLVYYAAWCVTESPDELPLASARAKAYAGDAFKRLGVDCVSSTARSASLGVRHPALSQAIKVGLQCLWRARPPLRARRRHRRLLMDFTLTKEEEAFRDEVRDFIAQHLSKDARKDPASSVTGSRPSARSAGSASAGRTSTAAVAAASWSRSSSRRRCRRPALLRSASA